MELNDEGTGYQIGYAMIKDSNGLEYYLFKVMWLASANWSTIDGIAVSRNGKK